MLALTFMKTPPPSPMSTPPRSRPRCRIQADIHSRMVSSQSLCTAPHCASNLNSRTKSPMNHGATGVCRAKPLNGGPSRTSPALPRAGNAGARSSAFARAGGGVGRHAHDLEFVLVRPSCAGGWLRRRKRDRARHRATQRQAAQALEHGWYHELRFHSSPSPSPSRVKTNCLGREPTSGRKGHNVRRVMVVELHSPRHRRPSPRPGRRHARAGPSAGRTSGQQGRSGV